MKLPLPVRRWLGRTRDAMQATARHRHYDRLAATGLSPFVHRSSNGTLTLREARQRFTEGHFLVPNLSGFYHGLLRGFWERHGLGARCLLISETHAVAATFAARYPGTTFVTTDYFVDLQPHPTCDVVWDLCAPDVPDALHGFTSVICQATLEHITDPVQVMRNLAVTMAPGGALYVQTHTPSYHYHGWPRDYLRYFPDWFEDITRAVPALTLLDLLCLDGHAFATYRKA